MAQEQGTQFHISTIGEFEPQAGSFVFKLLKIKQKNIKMSILKALKSEQQLTIKQNPNEVKTNKRKQWHLYSVQYTISMWNTPKKSRTTDFETKCSLQ